MNLRFYIFVVEEFLLTNYSIMKNRFVLLSVILMVTLNYCTVFGQSPATDAEILNLTREYILNKDGSMVNHYSHKVKLLTHRAFHSLYGESFIVYNPLQQQLKINQAITTMADGKKVPSPSNAFNEVLPGFAANAPAYNHLREMVVTHTGLEVGATIDLDYTITSNSGYFPFLMGHDVIAEFSPVNDYKIIIKVPEGTSLNYKLLNLRLAPEISLVKGFQVYTFNFGKVNFAAQDPFLPAETDYLPVLSFSTAPSLQQAIEQFTGQPLFTETALQPEAERGLKKLIEPYKKDLQKILRIQEMVAVDYATTSIPMQYNGFKARTIADVYKTNSGTEAEKVVFLTHALRKAGFSAMPVAIIPQKLFDTKLGNLPDISTLMVRVSPAEGEPFYLPAVGNPVSDAAISMSSKIAIMLEPAAESIKSFDIIPVNNAFSLKAMLTIAADKSMSGSGSISASNLFNPYFRIMRDSSNVKSLLTASLGASSVTNFVNGRLTASKLESNFKFETKSVFQQEQQGYLFWEYPVASAGVTSWHANILTGKRDAPLQTPSLLKELYEFEITLPDNIELVDPEINIDMKKIFGSVRLIVKQEGRIVKVKRSIDITERDISLLAYPDWREMMNIWNSRKNSGLTFKIKK
jgi:hypothetical protein